MSSRIEALCILGFCLFGICSNHCSRLERRYSGANRAIVVVIPGIPIDIELRAHRPLLLRQSEH